MFWKKKNRSSSIEELQIIYATKTGNSKLVAKQAQRYYAQNCVGVACTNIYKFKPDQLEKTKNLLVVISTHGEGDPPPQANKFFIHLMNTNLDLSQLNYSICALGDSGYKHFCFAGQEIDKRFRALGAKAFYPRIDCDLDFSNKAVEWIKQSYKAYGKINNQKSPTKISDDIIDFSANQNFYDAYLIGKIKLSGNSNPDEVYHLTFKVKGNEFDYKPGDSIEIVPSNPESLVDKIIEKLPPSKNGIDLKSFLLNEAEITSLQLSTLEKYQHLANDTGLRKLIADSESWKGYIQKANVYDLLSDYPVSITENQLQQLLPKVKPRVYSIASSAQYKPGYFDLVVKTIRYDFNHCLHEGAGSVFMNENLAIGKQIKFIPEANPCFSLPENQKIPVIMIAVGTGIAPFRAFLKDREASKSKGETWLIWGIKSNDDYILYNSEFLGQSSTGILKKFDVMYSRDQNMNNYVQDAIQNDKTQFLNWVLNGAHIYVCGSIKMGNAVRNELDTILQQNQVGSVEKLEALERYHVDVY